MFPLAASAKARIISWYLGRKYNISSFRKNYRIAGKLATLNLAKNGYKLLLTNLNLPIYTGVLASVPGPRARFTLASCGPGIFSHVRDA